jgi:F-type H+-transporting ATPase subunit epsilon
MAQRATLHVTVLTSAHRIYDGEAEMVIAPGADGQLGILPRHAPLLTTLALGELRLRHGGADEGIFVAGGFLEVNNNVVTVLADDAERATEIDEARAEEARHRAEALLERHDLGAEEAALAAMQLERAVGRLKIAELHRSRGGRRRTLPPEQQQP